MGNIELRARGTNNASTVVMKLLIIFSILLFSLFGWPQVESEISSSIGQTPASNDSTHNDETKRELSIQEKLVLQQHLLEKKLDSLAPQIIPELVLRDSRHKLMGMIEKRNDLTKRLDRLNGRYRGESERSLSRANFNFNGFYMKVYDQLVSSKKIKYISPEISDALGLKDYLCRQQYQCNANPQKTCKTLKAFYLPLVDQIFIDPLLPNTEFVASLYHEVLHAFQYRYRFPLDMAFLIDQTTLEKPRLQRDEILSYLSLIYETQASWYEMQGHQPKRWMDVLSLSNSAVYWSTRLGHAVVSSLWHWASLLVPGKTGSQPGLQSFNDLLPSQDKIDIYRTDLPAMYPAGEPNALYFSEIILFGRPELFNLVGNLDIGFHKRLTQSIECNYYGKLNFLFESMSGNQAIVAQAHDLFHTNFMSVYEYNVEHCEVAISKDILESKKSPLVYWLSKEPNQLPDICKPTYSHWKKEHQELAHSIYSLHKDSPFNLMAKGVEGGTGGFDLAPGLLFNPQLEIEPLPVPKATPNVQQGSAGEY